MNSRTITCSINCPLSDVYKFASNPENLPQWVQSFCLSVKNSGDKWQMMTYVKPHQTRTILLRER